MARKTQGTKMYTIDPRDKTLLVVGCVTAITGIDSTLDQIETTCLDDDAREYEAGMPTPGTGNFTINFDPADASHVKLHELKTLGVTLPWAVGFGKRKPTDATPPPPTVDSEGNFDLPGTRDWIAFNGFMNSYPFDFALNAVITSNVGIQISGDPQVIPQASS